MNFQAFFQEVSFFSKFFVEILFTLLSFFRVRIIKLFFYFGKANLGLNFL
jgi:hypothetical protein